MTEACCSCLTASRCCTLPNRPDKFGTIQLIAFLQQLLSHGGYYDDNLEFINIDRIQIVGSMVPGTAVGRSAMNTRFTAHTRIAYMTYPSKEQLAGVFSSMLQKVWCTSLVHEGTNKDCAVGKAC